MKSSELKGFLTGLMFGDGYIDKGITKRSFTIKTIHKDFADKIKEYIETCETFKVRIDFHKEYIDKNGVKHKDCWELIISSHPYFAKKYHHFYNDYKRRIISKEAMNWINAIGLAYWYMSEGYICLIGKNKGFITNRRVELCTERFDYNTIIRISHMLQSKYMLYTSVIKHYNSYRIRIKKESYNTFYHLIFPYINEIPSMQYKLYFGYNSKPEWMNDEMWEYQNKLKSAIALTDKAEG